MSGTIYFFLTLIVVPTILFSAFNPDPQGTNPDGEIGQPVITTRYRAMGEALVERSSYQEEKRDIHTTSLGYGLPLANRITYSTHWFRYTESRDDPNTKYKAYGLDIELKIYLKKLRFPNLPSW